MYCSICLSFYDNDKTIKCCFENNHQFHPKCAKKWYQHHKSCPLCRSPFFSNDENDIVVMKINDNFDNTSIIEYYKSLDSFNDHNIYLIISTILIYLNSTNAKKPDAFFDLCHIKMNLLTMQINNISDILNLYIEILKEKIDTNIRAI